MEDNKIRYASVRPTKELLAVFELIKRVEDEQDTNRNSIFERAMHYVLALGLNNEIILKNAAKKKIDIIDIDEVPTTMKVRVDPSLYDEVVELFRQVFHIKRVKTPYLMKITLMAYLSHIQDEDIIVHEIKPYIKLGIDSLVFKQEYEHSSDVRKMKLYELSRVYLEEVDIVLNTSIREQVNKQIREISDYYNVTKYFPEKGGNFAKTNIIFVAKVLAGLILLHSEINGYDLSKVINNMETAIRK